MAQYRIKPGSKPYYHQGKFYGPGKVIDLPDGMKPGKGMGPIEDKAAKADKPDKGAKAE